MNDITFLTEKQCFGEDDKLDVFKIRGAQAAATDFSILLGLDNVADPEQQADEFKEDPELRKAYYLNNNYSLEGRTGAYWTKSELDETSSYIAEGYSWDYRPATDDTPGGRPAISFSSDDSILWRIMRSRIADDGVIEVEYGYYPQKAVSKEMNEELERVFKKGELLSTGRKYTINSWEHTEKYDDEVKFVPKQYEEFRTDTYGQKYIRLEVKQYKNFQQILSNGEKYKNGDAVWLEVLPVKWLVSEKEKIMVAEKILYAGVPLQLTEHYKSENFDETIAKKFLVEYFAKELEQPAKDLKLFRVEEDHKQEIQPRKTRLQKLNPDKTEEKDRSKMTDTERIYDYIDSGESVLIRGASGIGKTDRILNKYKDAIYLKLTNDMFSGTEELLKESRQHINDIANIIYERSKNSDEKVVILLDELLNVKPEIQNLVYSLMLNKMQEISGTSKLPTNTVIVATGNNEKDSNINEETLKSLEKKFEHVIDLEPNVKEWITEYAIPNKIHPKVIGYMVANYHNTKESEELKDIGYFYEKPEVGEQHLDADGHKGKNNTPRGWTSISNTLYEFEKNLILGKYKGKDVEDILKTSIRTKLRDEWAGKFFDFYNLPTLTPEEVVQGMEERYTKESLPQNTNEKFAYMIELITADENQVEACRDFIRKYCDPEYLSIYDIYWAGNDAKRMKKIAELQDQTLSLHSAKETEQYVQDALANYKEIGQGYKDYLDQNKVKAQGQKYSDHSVKDSKEKKENDDNNDDRR